MKRKTQCLSALALSLAITSAVAFDANVPSQGLPTATDYGATLLPDKTGVVSWKTLAKVEPVKQDTKIVPKFDPAITALDQTNVRLQGFMIPIDLGEQQRHFLISAVPPHCPFCLPAGPEAIVEVKAKESVLYSIEPIVLAGKLIVVRDDGEGILYRLVDATTVRVR